MPTTTLSERAKLDLREIWLYVARDSAQRADTLLDTLDAKCRILAQFPQMGQRRPELGADIHSFPVGNYVLFYRAQSDGIEVIRVLHGARDIGRLF